VAPVTGTSGRTAVSDVAGSLAVDQPPLDPLVVMVAGRASVDPSRQFRRRALRLRAPAASDNNRDARIQPIASSLVASTGKPCNLECWPWRISARVIFNEDWYSQRALCRVPTGESQMVIGRNIEDDVVFPTIKLLVIKRWQGEVRE
jgi:hypothetical protein